MTRPLLLLQTECPRLKLSEDSHLHLYNSLSTASRRKRGFGIEGQGTVEFDKTSKHFISFQICFTWGIITVIHARRAFTQEISWPFIFPGYVLLHFQDCVSLMDTIVLLQNYLLVALINIFQSSEV